MVLPDQNAARHDHVGSWYASSAADRKLRSSPKGDLRTQCLIVGGGLAGVSAAWQLADRGMEVSLVEARRIGWGASGRNGGFVSPGFAEDLFTIEAKVGKSGARHMFDLSRRGVGFVEDRIRALSLDDNVGGRGWLRVIRHPNVDTLTRRRDKMARDYDADLTFWPKDILRETLSSRRYFGGLHDPEPFHMDPLAYCEALAADAERKGAVLYECTRAELLRRHEASWRLDTLSLEGGEAAAIAADHVILATSAYSSMHLADLYAPLDQAVLPVATYIVTTEPLGGRLDDAIRFHGCIGDTRRAGNYYRIVGEGDNRRLLWGGRITTRRSEPQHLGEMLKNDILNVYPQLGDFAIDHAWTGLMGYTRSKMPVIGELEPGLWASTAFGGHGLNTTAMAAELIAGGIQDGDDRWKLFRPYHPTAIDRMVGGSSPLGRVATQFSYWSMQARDWWDERAAA